VKYLTFVVLLLPVTALAQGAPAPANTPDAAAPPAASAQAPDQPAAPQQSPVPQQPQGGTTLLLRGLEKITGRPTNIVAPIGKPVKFNTLTITVRYCYSTPQSETPETAAFVQIDDHRPDQSEQRIFSGWMYASSPSLNGVQHPLYDVWVLSCNNNASAPGVTAANGPVKVASPDSSDKDKEEALPEEAGK
jgi:hypothetical protein